MRGNEQIVIQLRSIKRLLALALLCLVVVAAAEVLAVSQAARLEKQNRHRGFFDQATVLYGDDEWDALLVLAEARLREQPRSTLSHIFKGMAYSKTGRYSQAIAAYRRAMELDPTYRETGATAIKEAQAAARKAKATPKTPPAKGGKPHG